MPSLARTGLTFSYGCRGCELLKRITVNAELQYRVPHRAQTVQPLASPSLNLRADAGRWARTSSAARPFLWSCRSAPGSALRAPPPLPRTPGSGTPGGVALRGHACPRASRVVELDACAEPPHRRARDAGGAAAVREPVLRAAAEPIRFPWMGTRAQPGEHAAPSALRPNPVPNASHCATPRTCGLTSTRLGFWEGGAVPHRRCTPCRWRDEGSARGPRLLRPTAGAAVLRFAFCSLFLIICPLSGVLELTPGTGSDAHRGGRRARRWRPGACEPRLQLQRRRRASHALRGRAGRPRSNGPAPRRHPGPGTARLSHDK